MVAVVHVVIGVSQDAVNGVTRLDFLQLTDY
jgi:hypothetical protein